MGGGTEARNLRWKDLITINSYSFGFTLVSGTLAGVLLPYLVALIVPFDQKNTYLANIRVASLALAMFVQPVAGMLSDRCAHALGRRRPYIAVGTLGTVLFLVPIGLAPQSGDAAYLTLLAGIVLVQGASNVALGAAQSLIPDLVPEKQRGRASGVKAVMELLPLILIVPMGPMLDAGRTWLVLGIIGAVQLAAMAVTVVAVHEVPLDARPETGIGERLLRLAALVAIFVGTTLGAAQIIKVGGTWLASTGAGATVQVWALAIGGLAGMVLSIVAGVYLSAWVGIGRDASRQRSFIWWVINRLFFLAAIGSIKDFALYYLGDVLHVPNPATATTTMLAVVGVLLMASALGGGYLADRIGRKQLMAFSALAAATGTGVLLLARDLPLVVVAASIIGAGTGISYASNWAMGTDLAPPEEAGRYLGIANLAGAGAAIVGLGIGGPLADLGNALRPGLGYTVVFSLYGVLFLLSAVALTRIRE